MPKKNKLSLMTALDANAGVFGKAADLIAGKLSGVPNIQPDIMTYEKLMPQDFDDLQREFGLDAVGQYVRSMEAKRLRRK